MFQKAFVVQCVSCGANVAAYDPSRSESKFIGEAVAMAAERGNSIAIVDTPVTVGGCRCKRSTEEPDEPTV